MILDIKKHTDKILLQKLTSAVHENWEDEQFGVEDCNWQIHISRSQLHHKLKLLINDEPFLLVISEANNHSNIIFFKLLRSKPPLKNQLLCCHLLI